jgi:glycosyltransferase involved in cell wall biosynthesis
MKLSIIIPAYNEEKRLPDVLWNYLLFFREELGDDFEIIVIPNNCSDKTFEVAEEFSKNNKQIRIYNISKYSGKGGAVLKGFEIAEGEYIGFIDADRSTSPTNFFKLYQNKRNFHGIIASRRIRGALITPKRTLFQDASSRMFNILVRLLFGFKYKDTQCGAKIFRKKVARMFANECKETSWGFDVHLLYLCKKYNLNIFEQPINWTDDAEGSKLNFKYSLGAVWSAIKLRFNFF